MAQKPWRTVQVGEDTGRFTREQIRAAVEAVNRRKDAKGLNGRRNPSGNGASSSTADEGKTARRRSTGEA